MTDEALKALLASCKKWLSICEGEGKNLGQRSCPLCRSFREEAGGLVVCYECPIYVDTNQSGCRGTPYQDARDATYWSSCTDKVVDEAGFLVALEEYSYLLGLLPNRAWRML